MSDVDSFILIGGKSSDGYRQALVKLGGYTLAEGRPRCLGLITRQSNDGRRHLAAVRIGSS